MQKLTPASRGCTMTAPALAVAGGRLILIVRALVRLQRSYIFKKTIFPLCIATERLRISSGRCSRFCKLVARYQARFFWGLAYGGVSAERKAVGDLPVTFLNERLNCESDWNPTSNAISLIRRFGFCRRLRAFSIRVRAT